MARSSSMRGFASQRSYRGERSDGLVRSALVARRAAPRLDGETWRCVVADFDGKVAIVTGGARGIGAATVEALCDDGAFVFIADVLPEGEDLARRLTAAGKCARFVKLDVTDEAAWKRLVDDIVSELGHVDILVNNAGIGTFEDVEQETRAGWDKVIAVNQMGVWLGMKYAAPAMQIGRASCRERV